MQPRAETEGGGSRICRGPVTESGARAGSGIDSIGFGVEEGWEGLDHDTLFCGESKTRAFYRGQAERAAPHGISVDVHAISTSARTFFGLSSISPLTELTGGTLCSHSLFHQRPGEMRQESIASSICKDIIMPRAHDGILRVRTSSEFSVDMDGVHGQLCPDLQLESLWHVASCRESDTFVMDLEFEGGGAGEDWEDSGASPTIQVAFAYSSIVPDPDHCGGDGSAAPLVAVRRLRVTTLQVESSLSTPLVRKEVDTDPVALVLLHKVLAGGRRR
ncbi:unnamed protein product [Discosporangium mesarthrocarpum]